MPFVATGIAHSTTMMSMSIGSTGTRRKSAHTMSGETMRRARDAIHRRGPPMSLETGRSASDEPMIRSAPGVVKEPSVSAASPMMGTLCTFNSVRTIAIAQAMFAGVRKVLSPIFTFAPRPESCAMNQTPIVNTRKLNGRLKIEP